MLAAILGGATSALGSRSAAPCAITAKSTSAWNAVFALKCTTDVESFDVLVNRASDAPVASVKVPADAGHLQCNGTPKRHGRQSWVDIRCEGSLAAGATARIVFHVNIGTAPCDVPAFKGTWKVGLADGSRLGARKLPKLACRARTHRRVWNASHVGMGEPSGGYGYLLELRAPDGFQRCIVHAPVWIQARSGAGWKTIVRTHMGSAVRPDHSTTVFGILPPGHGPGTYHLVAPKIRFGTQVCPAATATVGSFAK
jgi:hypothetical protein